MRYLRLVYIYRVGFWHVFQAKQTPHLKLCHISLTQRNLVVPGGIDLFSWTTHLSGDYCCMATKSV